MTLWLVPSEPIREQTLKALREPSNLLHQAVFSALGEVTVLEIEDALRVKPNILNGSNAIIVATMQAFKQEDMERLSVYKQNSEMMPHFEDVTDPAVKGNHSLVDVLRLRHPFVIVDEAHNQGGLRLPLKRWPGLSRAPFWNLLRRLTVLGNRATFFSASELLRCRRRT